MSTHTYHPRIWDPTVGTVDGPVLVDDCPRCQEHAEHPEWSLDGRRRMRLMELWTADGPWLSDLDKKAALRLYGVVPPEQRP